jgi:hypothetical protein
MVILFIYILGDVLTKINYSSSGKAEHFYRLVPESKCLQVYQKKTDKDFKPIPFETIKKFTYGINSDNLKKRFKSLKNSQLKSPWLFLSIITKKRSVDLYLEPGKLEEWFYGIKIFLNQINQSHKIISVYNFRLTKLKLNLINNLKEYYESKKITNDKYKEIINSIINGKIIYYNIFI